MKIAAKNALFAIALLCSPPPQPSRVAILQLSLALVSGACAAVSDPANCAAARRQVTTAAFCDSQ